MSKTDQCVILHAATGARGHHSLAHAYAPLVGSLGYRVQVEDILQRDRGADIRFTLNRHFAALQSAPWLWRGLYENWSRVPGFEWGRRTLVPLRFRETLRFLRETDPAVILTTHALGTGVATYAKSRGWIRSKIVAAFYNWHLQPFWITPLVDGYLTVTERQARLLAEGGVAACGIETVGMPVDGFFYQDHAREEWKSRLGLPEGKLLFVTSGGTGWRAEAFLEIVRQIRSDVCVVIGGVPEPRRAQMERDVLREPGRNPIRVLGPCDLRPYFAAADVFLGKPAMSVAEALTLGLPTIVGFPVPGHDEWALPELLENTPAAALPNDQPAQFLEEVLSALPEWRACERREERAKALMCPERVGWALQRMLGCG